MRGHVSSLIDTRRERGAFFLAGKYTLYSRVQKMGAASSALQIEGAARRYKRPDNQKITGASKMNGQVMGFITMNFTSTMGGTAGWGLWVLQGVLLVLVLWTLYRLFLATGFRSGSRFDEGSHLEDFDRTPARSRIRSR